MKYFLLLVLILHFFTSTTPCQNSNDFLFPVSRENKCGFINIKGEIVIKLIFDGAKEFSEGLAPVLIDDKWGYIDQTGKIVIKPQFYYAGEFKDGVAIIEIEDIDGEHTKKGFINKQGKIIVPPIYDIANNFTEGLAAVKRNSEWSFIDKEGKTEISINESLLTDQENITVSPFSEGFAKIFINYNQWGLIDKEGHWVINPQNNWYWFYGKIQDGIIPVLQGLKWGYIDKSGQYVLPPIYEGANGFSEGLACVKTNGKWGYINRIGDFVIPPKFLKTLANFTDEDLSGNASDFSEGLAAFMENNKIGFIDKTGKVVISPKYDYVTKFKNGVAKVFIKEDKSAEPSDSMPTKSAYITKSGKVIWQSE